MFLLAWVFISQTINCQDTKLIIDRGDSVYYSSKIPANLKDIYGTYKTSEANNGYAVLKESGNGIYRYPAFGFGTKRCPVEDIELRDWGIKCDKKGLIVVYKNNGAEQYTVVLISKTEKKFEACYADVKEATLVIQNNKWILGADTRWEKQQ